MLRQVGGFLLGGTGYAFLFRAGFEQGIVLGQTPYNSWFAVITFGVIGATLLAFGDILKEDR